MDAFFVYNHFSLSDLQLIYKTRVHFFKYKTAFFSLATIELTSLRCSL